LRHPAFAGMTFFLTNFRNADFEISISPAVIVAGI